VDVDVDVRVWFYVCFFSVYDVAHTADCGSMPVLLLMYCSIADLEDFLASPARILALVDSEAQAVAAKHGTPRKTLIVSEEVGLCTTGHTSGRVCVAPNVCLLLCLETGRSARSKVWAYP